MLNIAIVFLGEFLHLLLQLASVSLRIDIRHRISRAPAAKVTIFVDVESYWW